MRPVLRVAAALLAVCLAILVLSGIRILFDSSWDTQYFQVVYYHYVVGIVAYVLLLITFFLYVASISGFFWAVVHLLAVFYIHFSYISPHAALRVLSIGAAFTFVLFLTARRGRRLERPQQKQELLSILFLLVVAVMLTSGVNPATGLANSKLLLDKYNAHGWIALGGLPMIGYYVASRLQARVPGHRVRRAMAASAMTGYVVLMVAGAVTFDKKVHARLTEKIENEESTFSTLVDIDRFDEPQPILGIEHLAQSESCERCHPRNYRQWQYSTHRFAGKNRIYLKSLKRLSEQVGPGYVRYCDNCHDPALCFAGSLEERFQPDVIAASEGVSCKVCHLITEFRDGGPYTVVKEFAYPGAFQDAADEQPAFQRNAIMLDARPHARSFKREIYDSPEYCMACHHVNVPSQLNGAETLHLQALYSSWKVWAGEDGSGCNACHMPPLQRDDFDYLLWDHRFPGNNQAISYLVFHEEEEREGLKEFEAFTEAFLQGRLHYEESKPHGGIVPEKYTFGKDHPEAAEMLVTGYLTPMVMEGEVTVDDTLSIRIDTFNEKVGHRFPLALGDLNEFWIELTVVDDADRLVFSSGLLGESGYLDPEAHKLGARYLDKDGNPLVYHEIWKLASVTDVRLIEPRGSVTDRYVIPLPKGFCGSLVVTARWLYRRVNQEIIDWVFDGDGTTLPVTELSKARRRFTVSCAQ